MIRRALTNLVNNTYVQPRSQNFFLAFLIHDGARNKALANTSVFLFDVLLFKNINMQRQNN